jgi:hypothetical protein
MTISQILQELNLENGSNYKKQILEKHKENELWLKVLHYAYNPNFKYHQKKIPNYNNGEDGINYFTTEQMFDCLDKLKSREVTGNDAIDLLHLYLTRLSKEDALVLELIIGRDIKSGINATTINKIYKDLLPESPYQRCSKLDEKTIKNINFNNAVIQKKLDGLFCYAIKENNYVIFSTRNGTQFECPSIANELLTINEDNFVLSGELLIKENNVELDRKTGNGLINSYIKRESTLESITNDLKLAEKLDEIDYIESNIVLECWDKISLDEYYKGKSQEKYKYRFTKLENIVNENNFKHLELVESLKVNSIEEAKEYANNQIKNGFEGAILKSLDSVWKDGTSKDMLKLKQILDIDLLCVDVELGNGKYEGKIGSLMLESKCSKIKVSVGSGMTDKDRELPIDYYIGKVIEVQYNELIQSKSKDTYSLFLPIFVEVREKKDYNSLEDVL